MDIEKLCMGCMKELEHPGICPHCGFDAGTISVEGHYLRPYTILNGKYLVGRVLGEGGFGITYIGYDLNLEMPVAIKEFYPNGFVTRESGVTSMVSAYQGANLEAVSKWKNNFIKEARTLAKCSHLAGIVGVKDFFEENGTAYIAMEYLEGVTLKAYVKSCGGRVEIGQLLKCLEPVMTALARVHEYGLIHRDISPDNIMLLPGGQMKLLDFGAARDYAAGDEKSLSVMLKPGYAPEEQYRTKGKQGPWSDVYAFAATIYKCVTGVTPPESMERMRQDEIKKPSELGIPMNPQTENAILKGMEVYAENRYQSMTEFKAALFSQNQISVMEQPMQQTQTGTVSAQVGAGVFGEGISVSKIQEICRRYWVILAAAAGILFIFIIIAVLRNDDDTSVPEETAPAVDVEEAETEIVEEEPSLEELAQRVEEAIENGRAKYNEGDYEAALTYLEEAKNLDASKEEIYSLASDIYMNQSDIVNAVGILDEGIAQTNKITLDTRRKYIVENTVLTTQEKYQNGILTQLQNYNSDGNLATQYLYDGDGALIEWGEYTYADGILTSQVHYYENGVQKWGIAYDEYGRENVYASYNQLSRMTEVYLAEYDGSGRLSRKVYYEPDGLTINSSMRRVLANGVQWWKVYEYNQYGNQVRDISYNTDGSLSSWQDYSYDSNGNMVGYTAFYANGELSGVGECSYDENGNRTAVIEYDAYGNITWRKECEYDALGNCVRESFYYGDSAEVGDENYYVNTYQFNG